MRIAFFNWRDIKNPNAGGAEVYCHQVMKRLAEQGNKVTLFTSSFPGSTEHEFIDGIEHIRYGTKFLIYPKSYSCYKKHIEGRYDVIVESVNGVPFFTTLFAKEKVVPFIHQLTRQNWYSGISFPIAFAGYHLEDRMLSIYKKNPAMVPSASTESDLKRFGFTNIRVIHGAGDVEAPEKIIKEKENTLIYLGRLTKSKRVDHIIRMLSMIKNAKLWVVGSGPEENNLKNLSNSLGLSRRIEFFGKISQEKKAELFSKAHVMLFPAVREGWGITVLEANACGTPVIGYDVHGLRDSIKNGVNGYLVEDGNIDRMAECAVELFGDEKQLEKISKSSVEYSKRFSWDKSAEELSAFLENVIK